MIKERCEYVYHQRDGVLTYFSAIFLLTVFYKQIEEYEQVKEIKGLNIDCVGFVCSSGFMSKIEEFKYLELKDIFFD